MLASGVRSSAELSRRLSETPRPTKISFDVRDLGAWDNILIEFLTRLEAIAGERGVEVDRSALPGGVERLVALARAVPERAGARRTLQRPDLLTRVGVGSLSFFVSTADLVTFLGEAIIGARPDHPDEPRRQCAHALGELRGRRALRTFPAGCGHRHAQAGGVTAMREPILVINAGSSSIKFSVFETMAGRSLSAGAHGQVEGIGTSPHLEITG